MFNLQPTFPGAPKWFFGILAAAIAVTLVLWTFPELRQELTTYLRRAPVAMKTTAAEQFPHDCIAMQLTVPKSANLNEMRLAITRSVTDMQYCNPRKLLGRGSDVMDIANNGPKAEYAASVILRLRDGVGVFGVKDDNKGGKIIAIRCNSDPAIMGVEWGTFVPEALALKDTLVPESNSDRRELLATCREIETGSLR